MYIECRSTMYRLGQKLLEIFQMPKRMRSLISNYLIINCDIQQPSKCLYLEHDQSMPLCYASMDPFVTSRMACKNEVGR